VESAYKDEIKSTKTVWDEEMKRLAGYAYDESFEPIIKAKDPRTIPEFVKLTGGVITQTAAICAVRECIGKDDIIITAGGSLPSCFQRMWTTDKRGGYHAEYGYSCMGYEVAAALGVKMAEPEHEVYAFVGDGSFQMLHSEIMTAMQERVKINILVFDNCGFGCINNLQMRNTLSRYDSKSDGSDCTLSCVCPENQCKRLTNSQARVILFAKYRGWNFVSIAIMEGNMRIA